jgi:hypothetical protein
MRDGLADHCGGARFCLWDQNGRPTRRANQTQEIRWFSNTTGLPTNFTVNYAGSNTLILKPGSFGFAVINAPNAIISMTGNSNFFGQVLGTKVTVNSTGKFYWDKALANPATTKPFVELAVHEL